MTERGREGKEKEMVLHRVTFANRCLFLHSLVPLHQVPKAVSAAEATSAVAALSKEKQALRLQCSPFGHPLPAASRRVTPPPQPTPPGLSPHRTTLARRTHVTTKDPAPPPASAASACGGTRSAARRGPCGPGGQAAGNAGCEVPAQGRIERSAREREGGRGRMRGGGGLRLARCLTWRGRGGRDPRVRRD